MSDIQNLHHQAMNLAESAFLQEKKGNADAANRLCQLAFEAELKAANLAAQKDVAEPTRSVLHRSAATLAIRCGKPEEAKRLIEVGLKGNVPTEIAYELRELLTQLHQRIVPGRTSPPHNKSMTKSQIVAVVAEKAGITRQQAVQALDTVAELAYKQAKHTFKVPGLGKLVLVNRPGRTIPMQFGPNKGQTIRIPPKRVLKFRVAKAARDAILRYK